MDEKPIFRAGKRRKFARQKDEDEGPPQEPGADAQSSLQQQNADSELEDVSVSNVLKMRRQGKPRFTGMKFSNTKEVQAIQDDGDKALVPADQSEDHLNKMNSRFVGSSGQVVDVDKHMMVYIDSEMAKRHQVEGKRPLQSSNIDEDSSDFSGSESAADNPKTSGASKQSHKQNNQQISEVDLGPSSTSKNLARTEAAIARAQAGLPLPTEPEKPRKPRKPRLGRDGKPFRPRPRKRRNSADLARDALVEQVLHEHALDVYDKPSSSGQNECEGKRGADEVDDEQFAEEFRQQFMDAMADRQQRQKAAAGPKVSSATGAAPQGPKLGGGRSGRAMMAAMQAQTNTDKGK